MKEVKTKLLTALLMATVLFVGFLGYYFGVRAGYVADETEPWLTQPLQEASYIIGEYNSTHYYARNQTGYGTAANLGYEMLSSNASSVFNDVSTKASSVEGSVFVKAGFYNFTNPCMLKNNTKWDGEGYGTHLYLAEGRDNSHNDNATLWNIFENEGILTNVTIMNMRFNGNNASNYLRGAITSASASVYLRGARHCTVAYCWFINHCLYGFMATGWGGGEVYDNDVHHNYFEGNGWNQLTFGAGTYGVRDNSASFNYFTGACADIALCSAGWPANSVYALRTRFIGNIIDGMTGTNGSGTPSSWFGIKLESSEGCIVSGNVVRDVAIGIVDDAAGFGNHTITDNQINIKNTYTGEATNRRGIEIYGNHTNIADNTIACSPNNYTIAINLNGGNITVANNICLDNGADWQAISMAADVADCHIINNDFRGADYYNINSNNHEVFGNRGFVTENSGSTASCYNATWIPHGLAGDPTSITLSLRGNTAYNASWILRVPTILQSNSTHFQIEFNAWETVGWTQVALTVVEAQTVYWIVIYKL